MNFSFDADQLAFGDLLRKALGERAPVTRWITSPEAPDPAWRLITEDLSAIAPDAPDADGGLGLSRVELAIVSEELGRVVAPVEFVAGIGFGLSLLLACAHPSSQTMIRATAAGAPLVFGGSTDDLSTSLTLSPRATLTGAFLAPIGGRLAEHLVTIVPGEDGTAQLAHGPLPAASAEPLDGIDQTSGASLIRIEDLPVTVAPVDDYAGVVARARRRAALVVAAMALGGARACLEMTVQHASQRTQFGVSIGTFQAVKHRLADLYVECELTATATYLAACAADDDTDQDEARIALETATAAYRRAARDCVQLHGGMGFTWEHPAHLHLRRSESLASLFTPSDRAAAYKRSAAG